MRIILLLTLILPVTLSGNYHFCLDNEVNEVNECYNCTHSYYKVTNSNETSCDGKCRISFCLPDSLWCRVNLPGSHQDELVMIYLNTSDNSSDICLDPFTSTESDIGSDNTTVETYHLIKCREFRPPGPPPEQTKVDAVLLFWLLFILLLCAY